MYALIISLNFTINHYTLVKLLYFRQQFRAHPLNEKIFKEVVGVKKVAVRPLTIAATPDLALRKRAAGWRQQLPEEKYEFHANPVPKAILEGPTVGAFN